MNTTFEPTTVCYDLIVLGEDVPPTFTVPDGFVMESCDFVDCPMCVLIPVADLDRALDVMLIHAHPDTMVMTACANHRPNIAPRSDLVVGIENIDAFGVFMRNEFVQDDRTETIHPVSYRSGDIVRLMVWDVEAIVFDVWEDQPDPELGVVGGWFARTVERDGTVREVAFECMTMVKASR